MKYASSHESPIGTLWLAEEDGAITELSFSPVPDTQELETPLLKRAAEQLTAYFAGQRQTFDLPLDGHGTAFQQAVWSALLNIPYGEIRSYKDIAVAIGNEKACRAVGMANNKNPIAIIVPCHRVVGANGSLVGYGGGLDIKHALLDLEKRYKYNI